ncbi:MAG: hypothetical protein GY799_20475, partial [Desulfobulbaceae bacterium]|nr:hypothetical protein [Desulfobulbaceae bacterium]
EEPKTVSLSKCLGCHTIQTDNNHQQSCISCHKVDNQAKDKDRAHIGYVHFPAHPDHLAESCGSCHAEIVELITDSLHFTLNNSTNVFRKAFGAEKDLTSFLETPKKNFPETKLELADDLLRRRCFRCHPYSAGDAYPSVSHGTGCAACHMVFNEGQPDSHSFQKPGDAQCLSCHYGNYVGFDYYGRFEHDFNVEYRTPYTTKNDHFRPYGVEYHQLKPDVHQLRGMLCIDCHSGAELMHTTGDKPSCKKCHSRKELQRAIPAQVENQQGLYILHGRDGKDHPIPLMQHPAHIEQKEQKAKVTCQACHAQWTFNDFGKHFLRSDTDDFDTWANLSIQGNLEIETIIEYNNVFENEELPAQMTDKITGVPEIGLWHKGLTMRRWENIMLGRDDEGKITTIRPVLDYSLSWIDEEETVRFDSVLPQAPKMGFRPYVPHTTGPAGLFYQERIEQFLKKEGSAASN